MKPTSHFVAAQSQLPAAQKPLLAHSSAPPDPINPVLKQKDLRKVF